MSLEAVLVAVAGFVGCFVSTLASNGSSVTLPALDLLGLPEHVANGTNRLSVVALGLVGTVHFYREGLVDWREGARIAVLIALGTVVGSFIAIDVSDAVLDATVIAGLLLVLGMLGGRSSKTGSPSTGCSSALPSFSCWPRSSFRPCWACRVDNPRDRG